jgi:Transposase
VLVVNAQHIKAVPGRKTDVKDAEWIADLLQHGLLKASFIPSGPQREMRDLTRYPCPADGRESERGQSRAETPGRYEPEVGRCRQ